MRKMDIAARADISDMFHEKGTEQISPVPGMNVGMDACKGV